MVDIFTHIFVFSRSPNRQLAFVFALFLFLFSLLKSIHMRVENNLQILSARETLCEVEFFWEVCVQERTRIL